MYGQEQLSVLGTSLKDGHRITAGNISFQKDEEVAHRLFGSGVAIEKPGAILTLVLF